ncbi:MAG TPA: hypothetical protein VIJ72_02105 [Rhizomicrobium sp.]
MKTRFLSLLTLIAFALLASPASAAVTITFYSHDLRLIDGKNTDFPHAFVMLDGTDASGADVHKEFGFSARHIFINVLWEPVEGALDYDSITPTYMAEAKRHFSFTLSDAQYRAVIEVVRKWASWPQPSYDVDSHNCVTFVKEIAVAVGLAVSDDKKFVRHPRAFLDDVAARNARVLAQIQDQPQQNQANLTKPPISP